jgi:uncharacterized protein YkwD
VGTADPGYDMTATAIRSRLPRLVRAVALAAGLALLLGACQFSDRQLAVRSMINNSRESHERRTLPMHQAAANKAQGWADHLARCNCLEHSNLSDGLPSGWRAIAENVGRGGPGGTLRQIHTAFMNSGGHRANILDSRWTHVGTGVATRGTEKFVVHVFVQY